MLTHTTTEVRGVYLTLHALKIFICSKYKPTMNGPVELFHLVPFTKLAKWLDILSPQYHVAKFFKGYFSEHKPGD